MLELLVLPVVTCRLFGYSLWSFWTSLLVPLLAPASAALAVALAMKRLPPSRPTTVGMLLCVVAACWGTWFLFVLSPENRLKYTQAVRRRLPF